MYEGRHKNSEEKEKDFFAESPFNAKKEATREDRMNMYSKIFIIRSVHAKYS